jgi:hypothetical protein
MGRHGDGAAANAFEKQLGGVEPKGKRERGPCGRIRVEEGEGGEGGLALQWAARGGRNGPQQLSAGGAVATQTGAGVGRGRPGASVTDTRDRGEAVPGGSGRGARERKRERQGGDGVPTCGSGRHSAGWCSSNWN